MSSFPTSTVVATPVLNPPGVPLTPAGFISGPVTPMPNYTEMATPWLKVSISTHSSLDMPVMLLIYFAAYTYVKSQLLKFGVRPLPKKKTIAKLIEIYEYLHPVVNGELVDTNSYASVCRYNICYTISAVCGNGIYTNTTSLSDSP